MNTVAESALPLRTYRQERRRVLLRKWLDNRLLTTGSGIIALVVAIAFLGPVLVPYTPLEMDAVNRLTGPSWTHLFGTDNFGRDVFSRVVYGTRSSIIISLSVTVIASLIGMLVGLLSAYYALLDHILMRICDGLFAFPSILLAIAIMSTLGPKTSNVVIALSIIFIPSIARIIRSAALVVREKTFIEALHAQGAGPWRIIWLHIAPNTLSPLIIQASFVFAVTILTEAALSFLGAGIPAPQPSLGNILYDGKIVIYSAWWMTVFPGILVILIVLGLNLFGDGLRDLLDPKLTSGRGK
ncbi:ABC transporter permease [Paenibacillus filicis]|uniref:ABC transporter permease n=1 Tax=Paenibacillus filicis TaxID=669464 RepID=A0ABU9DFT8_9BACL